MYYIRKHRKKEKFKTIFIFPFSLFILKGDENVPTENNKNTINLIYCSCPVNTISNLEKEISFLDIFFFSVVQFLFKFHYIYFIYLCI